MEHRTLNYRNKKRIFVILIPVSILITILIYLMVLYYGEYIKDMEIKNKGVVCAVENLVKENSQIQKKEEIKASFKEEAANVKKVYLTFDDGPSTHTEEILRILKENDVKATFFVIGKTDDYSKQMYNKIVEEGHTLAMHSYSHDYSSIYSSVKDFKDDLNKIENLLTDVTGQKPKYYRFPGGSSNTVSKVDIKKLITYLNEENIIYFDWNVVNGDAESSKPVPKNKLVKNVMTGIKNYNSCIVLMHDAEPKETTVEALPEIIRRIKKQGAQILPIDENTKVVQHIKADSVD